MMRRRSSAVCAELMPELLARALDRGDGIEDARRRWQAREIAALEGLHGWRIRRFQRRQLGENGLRLGQRRGPGLPQLLNILRVLIALPGLQTIERGEVALHVQGVWIVLTLAHGRHRGG